MSRQEYDERVAGGMADVFDVWRAAAARILADPTHPGFLDLGRILMGARR